MLSLYDKRWQCWHNMWSCGNAGTICEAVAMLAQYVKLWQCWHNMSSCGNAGTICQALAILAWSVKLGRCWYNHIVLRKATCPPYLQTVVLIFPILIFLFLSPIVFVCINMEPCWRKKFYRHLLWKYTTGSIPPTPKKKKVRHTPRERGYEFWIFDIFFR